MNRYCVAVALSLLAAGCASSSNDPESAERRGCRMEAEAVRMQVEQQEQASAPRIPGAGGVMTPTVRSSGGFAAYRTAYEDCLRIRAAQRPRPAS